MYTCMQTWRYNAIVTLNHTDGIKPLHKGSWSPFAHSTSNSSSKGVRMCSNTSQTFNSCHHGTMAHSSSLSSLLSSFLWWNSLLTFVLKGTTTSSVLSRWGLIAVMNAVYFFFDLPYHQHVYICYQISYTCHKIYYIIRSITIYTIKA